MAKRLGAGRWRPIYRFVVHQGDRDRVIDDGRRGVQNAASAEAETIYTIGADLVPNTAAALRRLVQERWERAGLDVSWLELYLSTDDLPDAFRGVPIAEDDRRSCVVAVWSP